MIFSDLYHIIRFIESASYFVRKPDIWCLLQGGSGTRCRWISRGTAAHFRSDVTNVNRWLSRDEGSRGEYVGTYTAGTILEDMLEDNSILALGNDMNCMLHDQHSKAAEPWFKLHTSAGARPQKPLWASGWTP